MTLDRYGELCVAHRWSVPAEFNIGQAVCGRHASAPSRLALLWEDETGLTARYTFRDLQSQANRLSNGLTGLGIGRGGKVAIVLPQRPETAIAHIACYQLGAVTVPLSFLFGPDALEYRLQNSEAKVVLCDPASLPGLAAIRPALPALSHVIGVAGARESWTEGWESLLASASDEFAAVATRATDPAVLVYTSGTTGPPKGALMPHQCLLGNLPGFIYSHDLFPQDDDLFWSPADWAWTGGLMDALLPTLYFGRPIVGHKGRFSPELAFQLMERHGVTHTFLFPTALKAMMKAYPRPREQFRLKLQAIMSAGEAVGDAVFAYCRDQLGVVVNEMFGQTEINYVVGNCAIHWPARPGSMGRPYPGHRVAVIDDDGNECPRGTPGDVALHRRDGHGERDPIFFLGYWKRDDATRAKFTGDVDDSWCRTGDTAVMDGDGYLWYQGRSDDVFKSAGYRIGPSEVENCLVKHPAVANAAVVPKPDPERGALVKAFVVVAAGHVASDEL